MSINTADSSHTLYAHIKAAQVVFEKKSDLLFSSKKDFAYMVMNVMVPTETH